jgi:SNF2 family DNA or RNA helicase
MSIKYKTKPLKHQELATERFLNEKYGALFCEMGTGKTKIMLDIVQNAKKPLVVVVIAPNGLHYNWHKNEIPKHFDRADVYCWQGTPKSKKRVKELERFYNKESYNKFFLINVEALRNKASLDYVLAFLVGSEQCERHIIVDESTCIKNPKAQQTKAVMRLTKFSDRRWILNGTPITQGPLDLFTQCKFLDPDSIPYNTFTAFKHAFAVERVMNMGNRSFKQVVGYQNLDELTKIIEPFSLRLQKKDCLDLPEKTFIPMYVELTPQQEKIYKNIKDDCIALLNNGDLVTITMALTKIVKLHQILTGFVITDNESVVNIENNRIKALRQIAETAKPLVVFCAYKHNVQQIKDELGKEFKIVTYTGEDSANAKNTAVETFQNGEADMFLATSAAAKGLTLHKASTMVYYSNTYSLETRLQSQDRIHRIGQDDKCTYIDLIVPNSIDEAILKRLDLKKELSNEVLDDLIELIKQ